MRDGRRRIRVDREALMRDRDCLRDSFDGYPCELICCPEGYELGGCRGIDVFVGNRPSSAVGPPVACGTGEGLGGYCGELSGGRCLSRWLGGEGSSPLEGDGDAGTVRGGSFGQGEGGVRALRPLGERSVVGGWSGRARRRAAVGEERRVRWRVVWGGLEERSGPGTGKGSELREALEMKRGGRLRENGESAERIGLRE
uniref:Uncharacterized protein n=1 Tax=Knipowitschia caucasica TaxID=637954 RepID=A0AAV2JS23_KNICA